MNYGHGGNISYFSEKYSIPLNEIIDFSSNVNWFGPPPELLHLINDNSENIIHYPEITNNSLINSLSKFYNINSTNIITGNGSAELIYLIFDVLNFDAVFIIEPSFAEYRSAAEKKGKNVYSIIGKEQDNFKTPVELITSQVDKNSILFLSSPNNPTGYTYSFKELKYLVEKLNEKKSYLFVDEAFIDFIGKHENKSMISEISNYNNLLVLRSLTKILTIPGVRLGILATNSNLINKLKIIQPPWSVNYFAQLIGENVNLFKSFIDRSLKELESEKKTVLNNLESIEQIRLFVGEANYILMKILTSNLCKLDEFFASKRIMIRSCANYIGLNETYYRFAIRKRDDNQLFLQILKDYFGI